MINCDETLEYYEENDIDVEEEDVEKEEDDNDSPELIQPTKTRQDRISARKSNRESAKNSEIKVNAVPKKVSTDNDSVPQLKCVSTKNSTNTTSSSIEEYYKNAEQIEKNEEKHDPEKLKTVIKMFLFVDEEFATMAAKMKDLRDEKKQYEEYILTYMEDTQKNEIIAEKGVKLNKKVTMNKAKPKEEDVYNVLKEVFKDEDVAQKVTEKIYDSMPDVEDIKLKKDDPEKKGKKTVKK